MPFWAQKDPRRGTETGLLGHRLGGKGGQGGSRRGHEAEEEEREEQHLG